MTMKKYGTYGFLNQGNLETEPAVLLDFGIESRQNEQYDFDNFDRSDYGGFLFQYTLSGHGAFEYEGKFISLEPGTAFFSWMPENSRYYLPENEPDNQWEYLYIHMGGNAIQPFFKRIREVFGPCFSLPVDSFPIQLWLNLHQDLGNGRQLRRYEGGELVYRFLSSMLRTLETPVEPLPSPRIEKSILYLKEHFGEHLSIEDLAADLGFSTAYFTRLFTKETGLSPMAFLTQQRLTHSVFLLLNTSMTNEEIAAGCGFSCGNYFCKVFKKASGLSPAEYRKRYGG